jgi:hypothetical protein
MTMCCPLSGNDGDAPKVHDTVFRAARKPHRCSECREEIAQGVLHEVVRGLWGDRWDTFRTCLPCMDIRHHFGCNGWVYGQLWDELEENFFPDMKVGGPCMAGLSPRGKQKLIDARLEWVLAHDEWEPEGFALPPQYQPQKPRRERIDTRTRIAEFGENVLPPMYPDYDE